MAGSRMLPLCRPRFVAPLAVFSLFAWVAGATPKSDAGPLAIVRGILAQAKQVVVGSGSRNEKLAALREVAGGLLDTRGMGRSALGPVLGEQPAEQQEEFLELFDAVVLRAYLQKMLFFRDPHFAYADPQIEGEQATVFTKILAGGDAYFVDYKMHRNGGGEWVALDVVIEGMSLLENYRSQFSNLLEDRSFEELLELMRRKRPRYAQAE